MLPFLNWSSVAVGSLHIQVWGSCVAAGILLALALVKRAARERGLATAPFYDMFFWVILAALVGARLAHVFFYEPGFYLAQPLEIFKVWRGGMSSTGGMVGAVVMILFWLQRHRLNFWAHGDVLARILPPAFALGRVGCLVTHTHPGKLTAATNWLAVNYPTGARWELSLWEIFCWLIITLIFWARPTNKKVGWYIFALAFFYIPTRFVLDFFRATDLVGSDAHYFGLTPAQYVMLGFFGLTLSGYIFWKQSDATNAAKK